MSTSPPIFADRFAGKVLVVTGAAQGIGRGIALRAAAEGGQVLLADRADFVRREFRRYKITVDDDTVALLLDAVGSDIRELAAACSQLVADTGGTVDAAAVRRYHSGKAEVTGFDVADKAVQGDVPGSTEALRWAMARAM